jgi:hypothetical protein
MKKFLLIAACALCVQTVFAQLNRNAEEYTGFNDINLGDSLGSLKNKLVFIDSFTWKGKTTTNWTYPIKIPDLYKIGPFSFNVLTLTFDEHSLLSYISISRIPFKADLTYPKDGGKKDSKDLIEFVTRTIGRQPVKKLVFKSKNNHTYSYRWPGIRYRVEINLSWRDKRLYNYTLVFQPLDDK